MFNNGTNLNIVGYDGREIRNCDIIQTRQLLNDWYLDETHPFGHELCIVAMLLFEEKSLPWVNHQTEDF